MPLLEPLLLLLLVLLMNPEPLTSTPPIRLADLQFFSPSRP